MIASHPLSQIVEWLGSQPEEVRSTTALLVATKLMNGPADNEFELLEDPFQGLSDWLIEREHDDANQVVSVALHVRELIQFFVMEHFGTKEQWSRIKENTAGLIVEFEKEGQGALMTDPLVNVTRQAPFRQRLWHKAAKDWTCFSEDSLSNETLRLWLLMND